MAISLKRNRFFIPYTNLVFFFFLCISLLDKTVSIRISNQISDTVVDSPDRPLKSAVFALGSFWRSEAAFGCINGVVRTSAGYAGGTKTNPEYRNLGDHAESVQVGFIVSILRIEPMFTSFIRCLADMIWFDQCLCCSIWFALLNRFRLDNKIGECFMWISSFISWLGCFVEIWLCVILVYMWLSDWS